MWHEPATVTDRVETLDVNSLRTTAEHFRASVTVNDNASSRGQDGRSRSSASVINALNEPRSTHHTITISVNSTLQTSVLMAARSSHFYSSTCWGTELQEISGTGLSRAARPSCQQASVNGTEGNAKHWSLSMAWPHHSALDSWRKGKCFIYAGSQMPGQQIKQYADKIVSYLTVHT